MKKNKQYDDDDGRTIADMSDIGGQPFFLPRRPARSKENGPEQKSGGGFPGFDEAGNEVPKEERNIWIFAALKAGLLIALAYILGAAALIGFLLLIWQ